MVIYFVIVLAVAARFIPHMPNFAPITALAIFSAATMDWKKAVGITLAARFISDLFIGFFSWPMMVAVYASHLVGVLFGLWIKNSTSLSRTLPQDGFNQSAGHLSLKGESIVVQSPSPFEGRVGERLQSPWIRIIASSLGASIIFFLVTNFAFLYSSYPHNMPGIILAYTNGLPFFRGTLLGDLEYSLALFGGLALAQAWAKRAPRKETVIVAR